MVFKFKEKLISEINNLKMDDLINLSLVGSFQYANSLNVVNDVDIIIIVNQLTSEIYSKINSKFITLAESLTTDEINIIVENRIGPLKPQIPCSGKVVQLHLLIYDLETWKNRKRKTVSFDWVNFCKFFFGTPLKDLTPLKELKKEDLIQDWDINKSNILNRSAFSRVYFEDSGMMVYKKKSLPLSKEEYAEGIIYNVLVSFLNYLRYIDPSIIKQKEVLLENGVLHLSKKYSDFMVEIYELKSFLRNGNDLAPKEISLLRKSACDFIDYLYSLLESK
ncbi:hypothetical protein HOM13_01380 [Candidatus Woesearchaeota archaeon]|jgi:hypothetical protein|nr:hypothetical protein [Candidatus Woesearchaeota archaeon]MBT5215367.1 hypothetical protein [Candidatus Woesearchaeota archaeon]MBT6402086.1 hypothetical protein [Candidatus Woesearchaeota archaeon]